MIQRNPKGKVRCGTEERNGEVCFAVICLFIPSFIQDFFDDGQHVALHFLDLLPIPVSKLWGPKAFSSPVSTISTLRLTVQLSNCHLISTSLFLNVPSPLRKAARFVSAIRMKTPER